MLQKSTREGFGLGVAEARWKSKPVIGGFAGGITAQVVYGVTGYTVNSVEGAAFRARQLVADSELRVRFGAAAHEHVRQNFLEIRAFCSFPRTLGLGIRPSLAFAARSRAE